MKLLRGEEDKMNFTECGDCPCQNTDYERGSSCNLDYNQGHVKIMGGVWKTLSYNCRLDKIIYNIDSDTKIQMEFIPEKVTIKDQHKIDRIKKEIDNY